MNRRKLEKQLRIEAERLRPNVLDQVYQTLGLEPQTTSRRPRFWSLGLLGAVTTLALAGTIVITAINKPIVVSQAETYVRLQIVPASIANDQAAILLAQRAPDEAIVPTFSYKINIYGKTSALDNGKNNALHAENEAAKIIASGLELRKTINQDPATLAVSLTRLARQAGYLESYEIGNIVRFRLSGDDNNYRATLIEQIRTSIQNYLRDELIYGVATNDETMSPPDFASYQDFSNQLNEYRQSFDMRCQDHEDDDMRRGPNWGQDIDTWIETHGGHANHNKDASDAGHSAGR